MRVTLAHIGPRPASQDPINALVAGYLDRCSAFATAEARVFRSEAELLEWLRRQAGRERATAILLDSRGKTMTSEAFAKWIGARRDEGGQHLVFAVGPADGWSDSVRSGAALVVSLGAFTMAHALARLVLAEQIYRAFTILAGHPYHTGH